ncbi:MAG: LicD family protein [Ruminococcus sp.]|nr:LicD family protein [Ruminococcus sp.]
MKVTGQQIVFKNHDVVNKVRADILKIIDDICTENNLKYFAFKDLLIGAVHYKDFIPTGLKSLSEIGLMRDDYNKLCEILYKRADELGLALVDRYPSGAKSLNLTVARPITIDQEDLTLNNFAKVEISAFDFLPDSEAEQKMYLRTVANLRDKYNNMVNLTPPHSNVPLSLRKVFGLFWATLVYGTKNPKKTYHKLLKSVSKYKNTKYITRLIPRRSVTIAYDDIFPTKRIKLNHTEINVPRVFNTWTVEINDELMEQTRTIQKIDLVLLKEFDRVCREIGVGYFICGGTMLGYKRHGGFIPWDDDIDVGMLRADYDKFLKEGGKYLGEDFFLQTRKSDPKIPYLFSKIRLNGTSYITNYNEKRDFHKGICLDLFPFDYIPNSLNERQRFKNKVLFWSNLHNKVINRHKEKVIYDAPAKTAYEWWARVYNEIRRKIVHLVPLKLTQKLYIKKATTYNSKAKELGLTTVASFVPTYTYADVDKMIPYQDINFEGVNAMALKDIEGFLTMQYNDYMALPLMHQRVGHDLISWHIDDEIAKKYHIYDD